MDRGDTGVVVEGAVEVDIESPLPAQLGNALGRGQVPAGLSVMSVSMGYHHQPPLGHWCQARRLLGVPMTR